MPIKKVLFITGARSDFYIQKPIIDECIKSKFLIPQMIITGSHLSRQFGQSLKEILKNYKKIKPQKVKNLLISDKPESRVLGLSIQLKKLIGIIVKLKPDILIAPFDREEALSIAIAGAYLRIPVAHIGAGDKTDYNIDGIVRHSVSKLSNLFFCFTPQNAERLYKMGEDKKFIFTVGHTVYDRYNSVKKINTLKLEKIIKLKLNNQPLIVFIQHPVSNFLNKTKDHIKESFKALDEINVPTLIIRSNSDPGTLIIHKEFKKYNFKKNKQIRYCENLPEEIFVNIIKKCSLILGNSSMGILEAPVLGKNTINIGPRQIGRQNANNIIYVENNSKKIISATLKILKLQNKKNKRFKKVYSSKGTAKRIVNILEKIKINDKLINKKILY